MKTTTNKTNGATTKNGLDIKDITPRTSKMSMAKALLEFKSEKMPKALKDSIAYALKLWNSDDSKVKQSELYTLVDQCRKLGATVKAEVVPMETLKKPTKKTKTAIYPDDVIKEEAVEEKTELETAEPPKKKGTIKKPLAKKVETVPSISTLGTEVEFATAFPTEIEHEEIGTLVRVPHNMFTSYKEVYKALVEEEKTIYIAGYWPKRMIKKYDYARAYRVNPSKVKNGFENDLDLINCVLPLETEEYVYAMSLYTEALYCFMGEDFKPLTDKDPRSGAEFTIRISAGLEFELYMLADEM